MRRCGGGGGAVVGGHWVIRETGIRECYEENNAIVRILGGMGAEVGLGTADCSGVWEKQYLPR